MSPLLRAPTQPVSNMSTLTNPVFTALRGCLVEIDGWQADLNTEPSVLLHGLCVVKAVDFGFTAEADRLMRYEAEEGCIRACDDPLLVELAMRHNDWCNDARNAPWPDTLVQVTRDSYAAFRAMEAWIRGTLSVQPAEPVLVFTERLELQFHRALMTLEREESAKRPSQARPRQRLSPPDSLR